MTELERFAALLLTELRSRGQRPELALGVAELLDRVLPYKAARGILDLGSVEEYELVVLRLIAEEGRLVVIAPAEASEMARATLLTRIPDLDVLQMLRGATLTFTEDAILRLDGIRLVRPERREAELPRHPEPESHAPRESGGADVGADEGRCWSCGTAAPAGRRVTFCVECGADQRPPVCGACGVAVERSWKHCPDCGASVGGGRL